MVKVEDYEAIQKKDFINGWSIRKISRELKHCRRKIRQAIVQAEPSASSCSPRICTPAMGWPGQRAAENKPAR